MPSAHDRAVLSAGRSADPGARPLRILVVSNLYPSARHPSFGTFVAARVEALRRAGAEVTVVAIRDAGVHRGIATKYLRLALATWRAGLTRALRRRRFDVVEAHIAFPTGWLAWPVALLHRAPLVLFVHGSDLIVVSQRSALHRFASSRLFGRASRIVLNSQHMADTFAGWLPSLCDRAAVRSPGIDYDLFRGEPAPSRGADGRDGLLFVGRLTEEKGIEPLLEAHARLRASDPEVTLTVIGTGPLRDRLDRAAHDDPRAGLRVLGPLPPADVARAMRRAEVLVVPSVSVEALGLVALEGMAAGAVVVATRNGGLAETVRDGETGLLANPGDPEDLARALRTAFDIARDPVRREALVAAGRDVAAGHSVDAVADASLADYRQLVGRRA